MSTRSHIVIEDQNGVFHYRYHHSDGYISGLGETIQKNFKTLSDIMPIFELGQNLSNINGTVKRELFWQKFYEKQGNAASYNSMNDRYKVTVLGKMLVKSYPEDKPAQIKKQTFTDLKEITKHCDEEFIYLLPYKTQKWLVSDHGSPFIPLTVAIKAVRAVEANRKVEWYENYRQEAKNYSEQLDKRTMRRNKLAANFLEYYNRRKPETQEKLNYFIGKSEYSVNGHKETLAELQSFANDYQSENSVPA